MSAELLKEQHEKMKQALIGLIGEKDPDALKGMRRSILDNLTDIKQQDDVAFALVGIDILIEVLES